MEQASVREPTDLCAKNRSNSFFFKTGFCRSGGAIIRFHLRCDVFPRRAIHQPY